MTRFIQHLSFLLFFLSTLATYSQVRTHQEKFSIQMLLSPKLYSEEMDRSFEVQVTPEFIQYDSSSILIENGYASSIIKNPETWDKLKNTIEPDTIKVIFSLYPKYQEFWMTNYHVLLAQRLKALFRIAPELNSNSINWLLVLQDDCENEPEALGLFHGFEISGSPKENIAEASEPIEEQDFVEAITLDSTKLVDQYKFVNEFIANNGGFGDSTVFKVLERNRHWEDAVVVLDWSTLR